MGSDGVAIRTEGLTKRYGRLTAVDGVSLSVPAGRVSFVSGHCTSSQQLTDC
jgi:ABC-type multidrug transport system ATPase subunit